MKITLSSFALPQTWQRSTGTLEFVPNALFVFLPFGICQSYRC